MYRLLIVFCFLSILVQITSCGFPSETITESYKYVDSGAYSRYIEKDSKRLIDDIVIQHSYDKKYIYALRQVVSHYLCNGDDPNKHYIDSSVQNIFEYWVIEMSSGSVYGPLSEKEFSTFIEKSTENKKLPLATIQEATEKKFWRREMAVINCKDAKLLDRRNLGSESDASPQKNL